MKKIPLIEFLKGYSIFTIVLYHFLIRVQLTGLIGKAILFGGTGVHLFIFLSGFGLFTSFLRKPVGFGAFIKKRLSRIYLPYILIVLLSAVISLFIPVYTNSAYALGGHIFLYKMFDNSINESYGGQFWFISTIIQLYFSFHLLVKLKSKMNDYLFILTGVVISIGWGIVVVVLHHSESRVWNSFFLQYIWEFMLGMVVAERLSRQTLKVDMKKIYYLIFGLILIAVYGLLALKGGEIGRMFNDIPALVGYSFLAIFIYQLKIKPLNNFFEFTGTISFSLFLIHILVINLVIYTLGAFGCTFNFFYIFLVVPLSYILSVFYNKIVEILLVKIARGN